MVDIAWRNKNDITPNIKELKKQHETRFKQINFYSNSSPSKCQGNKSVKNWTNKLFWGDNAEVLYYLLNTFEDKINLIYIDPPFFSGTNYQIQVKGENLDYETVAYEDNWDKDLDTYLQMLYERFILFKKLLTKTGLLFVHLDWHACHPVKMILDNVFGENHFINNIVWYYYNKYSAGKKNLPRAHDDILIYSKTNNYTFNELRIPREKPRKQLKRENVNGILKNAKDENGNVMYRIVNDKKLDDVWRIPCLQPASKEWTGFPTQKHHELIERIIELGSNEGDLIADFFCGSGTTLLTAERLKRKWIGCDISKYSIHLTLNRIRKFNNNKEENLNSIDFYTDLTEEKKDIIKSGFFEKDIKIRRKK
ncbi:MAG: DNA methyltransferase [Promethearchaeota archaeon]